MLKKLMLRLSLILMLSLLFVFGRGLYKGSEVFAMTYESRDAADKAGAAESVSLYNAGDGISRHLQKKATKVIAPKASKDSGTYTLTGTYLKVKLSTSQAGAVIYYSTDATRYKKYSSTLKLKKNTNLSFYAEYDGRRSEIVTRSYKVTPKITASVSAGEYSGPQLLSLTSKAPGVKLYYTLNGKKPTKSSKLYKEPIEINKSCTVRVLVVKSKWQKSYLKMKFVINPGADGTVTEADGDGADSGADGAVIGTDSDGADAGADGTLTEADSDGADSGEDGADTIEDKFAVYGSNLLGKPDGKLFYNTLSGNMKTAYELVYAHYTKNSREYLDLRDLKLTVDDMNTLIDYVNADSPELWYSAYNAGYLADYKDRIVSIELYYSNEPLEIATRDGLLAKKAEEIILSAQQNSDNMYDFVLYLHDYIVNNSVYRDDTSIKLHDMAGTDDILLDGKGLCVAYSRAFAYLCQRAGIPCVLVYGNGKPNAVMTQYSDTNHVWNKVCIDGKWYHVDVTFDDPTNINRCNHDYFCLSDDEMDEYHTTLNYFIIDEYAAESGIHHAGGYGAAA